MVSGGSTNQNQNPGDEREKRQSSNSDVLGGGGARSLSGGQSVSSTSGSVGSPSRSDPAAVSTPISERRAFIKLNSLDIQDNSNDNPVTIGGTKKKRGQRAVGADKAGRGLRQFSMRVCEKVESKGKTTYNQVADELVVEFADPTNNLASDQQQYDEKNIRRRVYDALNVLMAMDIISKDKKEIQWRGLPHTTKNDIEKLERERLALKKSIDTKARYLQELEEQYVGLENLISRNEKLFSSENAPSGGVHLPFILVQTLPHATVELEISEDMQLVHFDFNSTPFELHDDNYVLKAMKFCERPSGDVGHAACQVPIYEEGEGCSTPRMYHPQPQIPQLCMPKTPGRPPASPLPGIKEARVKNEQCSISVGF